jgi:hypothetical protein
MQRGEAGLRGLQLATQRAFGQVQFFGDDRPAGVSARRLRSNRPHTATISLRDSPAGICSSTQYCPLIQSSFPTYLRLRHLFAALR